MRFSALSSPSTGSSDSFDMYSLSDSQSALISPTMPPSSLITESVDGNACTTLARRLSSQFMRSWMLLVRILTRCSRGNERCASASTSASSSTLAAAGANRSSSSTARW